MRDISCFSTRVHDQLQLHRLTEREGNFLSHKNAHFRPTPIWPCTHKVGTRYTSCASKEREKTPNVICHCTRHRPLSYYFSRDTRWGASLLSLKLNFGDWDESSYRFSTMHILSSSSSLPHPLFLKEKTNKQKKKKKLKTQNIMVLAYSVSPTFVPGFRKYGTAFELPTSLTSLVISTCNFAFHFHSLQGY